MNWNSVSPRFQKFLIAIILVLGNIVLMTSAQNNAFSAEVTYRNFDVRRFWETYSGVSVPNVNAESFYALERMWDDTKRRYATKLVVEKIENARREWRAKLLELDKELSEVFKQAEKDAQIRSVVRFFNIISQVASTVNMLSKGDIARSSDNSSESGSGNNTPENSIIIDEKYERSINIVIDGKVETISTRQILMRYIKHPDAAGNPLGREMLGVLNQFVDKLPIPACDSNLESCWSLPAGSKLETADGKNKLKVSYTPPNRKPTSDEKKFFRFIKATLDWTAAGDLYTAVTGKNFVTGKDENRLVALGQFGIGFNPVGVGGKVAAKVTTKTGKKVFSKGIWKFHLSPRVFYKKYKRHKKEFPEVTNVIQYYRAMQKFLTRPPKGTLRKIQKDGREILYHPKTNTLGVRKDGKFITLFRPKNGRKYFNNKELPIKPLKH